MLTIEEYIARRKKEDQLNEFNYENCGENMRICVNYVFEYFNNYLDPEKAGETTVLHDEKVNNYRRQVEDYDPEIGKWLVDIYADHGKHLNRYVGNFLKEDPLFFLYNSDQEFRSLSYDCYSKLIKKIPFLKDQTEMLFLLIRDHQRVATQKVTQYFAEPFISDEIKDWVDSAWTKHQVSIWAFVIVWTEYFWEHDDLWPSKHKRKSTTTFRKYDYDIRHKSNLFGLDSLYRRMPKKAYTRGKKQMFEILMMYHWTHSLEGDDGYWDEYLEKVMQ